MKLQRFALALPLAAVLLSGCAMPVLTAKVSKPTPSALPYTAPASQAVTAIQFQDARTEAEKQRLSSGLFKVNFNYNGAPLNPASFVEENVEASPISSNN